MKRIIKSILLVTVLSIVTITAKAQFSIGGAGTNGSGINANGTTSGSAPTVPFDGGMSLMLLASGVGYAAKKLKKKQIASI